MRNISVALASHLSTGNTATIATIWHVLWKDGTELGFTDADQDLDFEGFTYESASGYSRSDISNSCTLEVDNLELQGMLLSPSITAADLRAGKWDNARITISLVNYADLTMGRLIQRTGRLGTVTIDRGRFRTELRGLKQALSTAIVELTSPTCRATLGDARCGVDLGDSSGSSPNFEATGSIESFDTDNVTIHDSARTEPPHPSGTAYYIGGKITWTTGLNTGLSMEIREATTGVLQMGMSMPYALQVGDEYIIVPGCPKLLVDCKGTFNNVLNFRGEPHLAGNDILFQVARA